MRPVVAGIALLLLTVATFAGAPRARDLGIPFDGVPGPLNAMTDVAGVTVGEVTLIESQDARHLVRTGVTAILPRGIESITRPVFAATFALNGAGEMTGAAWLGESGLLDGPVMITNTNQVGVVRDAVIQWRLRHEPVDPSGDSWTLPVVAETWDGFLNDMDGFHLRAEHAFAALDQARAGPVGEGNVGGGTGSICHEFKCGTGTASRRARIGGQDYTVGVLVQANHGTRDTLRIAGVPVGRHLQEHRVVYPGDEREPADRGSIIIVVATDAPLLPHQLQRLARRVPLALGRDGGYGGNASGDIFVAFSTANREAAAARSPPTAQFLANDRMDALFLATVEATEEAIVNALVAARDMQGADGHRAAAIPHAALRDLLRRYNRLLTP